MEKGDKNINTKKHVWLINSNGKAKQYGIGTYIDNIISILKCTNVSISIVDFSLEIEEAKVKFENGVTYFNLPFSIQSLEHENAELYYYGVAVFLFKYVNTNIENIFHFNYAHQLPLIDILKSILPHIRTIYTIHYLTWHFALDGNYTNFLNIITTKNNLTKKERIIKEYYFYEMEIFHKIDSIVCLSKDTYNLLLQYYDLSYKVVKLIRNGFPNIEYSHSRKKRNEIRKKLYIEKDEKIILYVGRLDRLKGVNYLLKAFQEVHKLCPKARLWIIGDGDFNLCLNEIKDIWKHITFTGKISQIELFELYQIADVGVIPSLCEQCSFVALEMLYFKLPIISTNAYGLKEMFINKKHVINLIEESDTIIFPIKQLTKKIIKCLMEKSNKDILPNMTDFSFEKMKRKMLDLYQIKP